MLSPLFGDLFEGFALGFGQQFDAENQGEDTDNRIEPEQAAYRADEFFGKFSDNRQNQRSGKTGNPDHGGGDRHRFGTKPGGV